VEIVVTKHTPRGDFAHEPEHSGGVRAAVDEVAYPVDLVCGRVEANAIEEPAKLLAAALHISDEDSASWARVHRRWNPGSA
jgi:hypothetical protein